MERLLTLQYYFTTRPSSDFQFTKITVTLIVLFLLSALAIKFYRKKYAKDAIVKKMLKKYPGRLYGFGAILLFLLLVREAGLPLVSMRIWWFTLLVYVAYWALKSVINFKKEYKKRSRQAKHNAQSKKYIPKRKK